MIKTTGMTLIASLVLLAATLVLLFPAPWVRHQQIADDYMAEQWRIMGELGETQMSAADLKSNAFSINRRQQDMWIRWSASLAFFALASASLWRYVKARSVIGKTGLFVAAVAYGVVWFFASVTLRNALGLTVLESLIARMQNELLLGNAWTLSSFLLIHALAPLASLALAFVLASEFNEQRLA